MSKRDVFRVKDFMSRGVLEVDPAAPISEAVETMVGREIGGLVVRSGEGVLGWFTERDLLHCLAAGRPLSGTRVSDAMSKRVTRIDPTADLREASRMMTKTRGRLVAFDGEREAGVVTASDIVKVIFRTGAVFDVDWVVTKGVVSTDMSTRVKFAIRIMDEKGIGSLVVTENRAPRAIFTERDLLNRVLYMEAGLDEPVLSASTLPIVSAESGIGGREAAGVMYTHRLKRLPLRDDGRLVGIVTARDVVQAYAFPGGIEDAEVSFEYRVRYGEVCPLCNTRIDDSGYCACGAGGE